MIFRACVRVTLGSLQAIASITMINKILFCNFSRNEPNATWPPFSTILFNCGFEGSENNGRHPVWVTKCSNYRYTLRYPLHNFGDILSPLSSVYNNACSNFQLDMTRRGRGWEWRGLCGQDPANLSVTDLTRWCGTSQLRDPAANWLVSSQTWLRNDNSMWRYAREQSYVNSTKAYRPIKHSISLTVFGSTSSLNGFGTFILFHRCLAC